MFLNLTTPEAFAIIGSPNIIRKDEVIPKQFPECPNTPYQPEYDWLFQYERDLAAFLGKWLSSYRYELIGEKGILCEALSNAFSHGNRKDPFKTIQVRIWLGENGLLVKIKDNGDGFNVRETYERYRKRKRYYALAGNGMRLMAESENFGVFYDAGGTIFYMLYLFKTKLCNLPEHMLLSPPHPNEEKRSAYR